MWWSTSKGRTLRKVHVSYFINMIMFNDGHVLLTFWLCTIKLMKTLNIQNQSHLDEFFQETINMANMANIEHYHSDQMRHLYILQGLNFWCAASHLRLLWDCHSPVQGVSYSEQDHPVFLKCPWYYSWPKCTVPYRAQLILLALNWPCSENSAPMLW